MNPDNMKAWDYDTPVECPYCGAKLPHALSMTGADGPRSGDCAVCTECLTPGTIEEQPGGKIVVRRATLHEAFHYLTDPRVLDGIRALQRHREDQRWRYKADIVCPMCGDNQVYIPHRSKIGAPEDGDGMLCEACLVPSTLQVVDGAVSARAATPDELRKYAQDPRCRDAIIEALERRAMAQAHLEERRN